MSLVSREMFLAPYVPPTEHVPCPEFGADAAVAVQGMTVRERSAFEQQFMSKKTGERVDTRVAEFRERLLVACCRSESGQPLFTLADIRQLGQSNPKIVERLVAKARELSGMEDDDSTVEDDAKNS